MALRPAELTGRVTGPVDGTLQAVLDGAQIAYSRRGSGPTAVYAHGLTSSRAVDARLGWADWTPLVAAGRSVVTYDARGHGSSTGQAVPETYTWPSLAGDLLALLDLWGETAPVSGIGSSLGTATLLHAVLRAPERFDRLVLTAPSTAWQTRQAQAGLYRAGADLVETRGVEALAALAAAAPTPPVLAGLEHYPFVPDVRSELLPSVLRGAATSDLPDPDALRSVRQPVLVLAWADDPGHPVTTAERLVELLPDAQLEVARSTADLRRWGDLAALFLTTSRG